MSGLCNFLIVLEPTDKKLLWAFLRVLRSLNPVSGTLGDAFNWLSSRGEAQRGSSVWARTAVEYERLASYSDEDTFIGILCELCKTLGLTQPPTLGSSQGIHETCAQLMELTIMAYHDHTAAFFGTAWTDMVRDRIFSLASSLAAEKTDAASALGILISDLNSDQLVQIQKSLGTDELTAEVLQRAAQNGALRSAFHGSIPQDDTAFLASLAVFIESSGPAAWMPEELPKTEFIRTLSACLSMIAPTSTFRNGKNEIIPLLLTIAALTVPSSAPDAVSDGASSEFIDRTAARWAEIRTAFREEKDHLAEIVSQLNKTGDQLKKVTELCKGLKDNIRHEEAIIENLAGPISDRLGTDRTLLDQLAAEGPEEEAARTYLNLVDRISERNENMKADSGPATGFAQALKRKLKQGANTLGNSVDKFSMSKALTTVAKGLVKEGLPSGAPDWLQPFLSDARDAQEKLGELNSSYSRADEQRNYLDEDCSRLRIMKRDVEKQVNELTDIFFSLD